MSILKNATPSPTTGQAIAVIDGSTAPVQQSSAGPIETFLKVAGLAGAVSAAMGLPAVYLHFKRLGIPAYYVDYQLILSAGILPTILLALIALYFQAGLKEARRSAAASSPPPFESLVFILIPVMPVIFAGAAAYPLLLIWAALSWVQDKWRLFDWTDRERLYAAGIVGILGALGWAAIALLQAIYGPRIDRLYRQRLVRVVRWLQSLPSIPRFVRRRLSLNEQIVSDEPSRPVPAHGSSQATELNAIPWLLWLPAGWIVGPLLCISVVGSIERVLNIWDSRLATVLPAGTDVWIGLGLGVMYGVAGSSIAATQCFESDNVRRRNIGIAIAGFSLLVATSFSIAAYATKVYPVLPRAWGGGRPELVTVWIDQKDVPPIDELHKRLPAVLLTQHGDLIEVGATLALSVGQNMVLLSGSGETTQSVVFPKESLKMVVGSPVTQGQGDGHRTFLDYLRGWLDFDFLVRR